MRNFKLYTLLISFIFLSCGIKVNHDYSISISKTNQYLNNGDSIDITIDNPSKNIITDLNYSINSNKINSKHILNNNLGVNTVKASFKVNDENFIISEDTGYKI